MATTAGESRGALSSPFLVRTVSLSSYLSDIQIGGGGGAGERVVPWWSRGAHYDGGSPRCLDGADPRRAEAISHSAMRRGSWSPSVCSSLLVVCGRITGQGRSHFTRSFRERPLRNWSFPTHRPAVDPAVLGSDLSPLVLYPCAPSWLHHSRILVFFFIHGCWRR